MKRLVMLTVLVITTLALLPWQAGLAQEGQPDPVSSVGPNVEITITVGDTQVQSGPKENIYRMVARAEGRPAQLLMGWRMPIPTTKARGDDDASAPVTSYVYQNIGMSASLEARVLDAEKIQLVGTIEVSGRREAELAQPEVEGMPVIGTFQQGVNVVLKTGKAMRIAEVPDPDGGTLYLQIQAKIMD
jgi:hypothetical protein